MIFNKLFNVVESTTTTTTIDVSKSYSIDIVKKDGSKGNEVVKIKTPATVLDLKNALKEKLALTDEKLGIFDSVYEKKDTDDISKGSSFYTLKIS